MHIFYTGEQLALREESRRYFALLGRDLPAPDSDEVEVRREWYRRLRRRLGADGWLGVGWPREVGGQGRTPLEQYVFFEEVQRAGIPYPMISVNTVGPTLMSYGSPQQQQEYLPAILRGDIEFSIGYTEPEAGSDLASLTTRAHRDGDEYVINGAKIFTSGAEVSDYIWLAARTDPDAPKHRGLSIFIVPTSAPGFSVAPLHTIAARIRRTTSTHYDNVRVPAANLVGHEGGGWRLITSQLNHERVAMAAAGARIFGLFDSVVQWAGEQPTTGGRLIDENWVRQLLARAYVRMETLKLHSWRVADALNRDELTPALASSAKVVGTEAILDVIGLLMQIVGERAYLAADDPGAPLAGRLDIEYQASVVGTFGGGNNDVQRELVAMSGLGLPRAPR
ncbi:acyl-CoA dehydrogenase family protein [Dactylosporangium roseum]|uniref:Acyl-CoA dehydrogenase family protein n=1 Tax=Dactylosporangium roseum TaxID=47989 RepID=A0ABY5YXE9_9ACTN|nr:acyl-CoA dehydrogenase family protein [Dactylosporangium roseum]UWZ34419.1 acyl-CoA dehydrogenase family protein [Dactylosporangium roseum]